MGLKKILTNINKFLQPSKFYHNPSLKELEKLEVGDIVYTLGILDLDYYSKSLSDTLDVINAVAINKGIVRAISHYKFEGNQFTRLTIHFKKNNGNDDFYLRYMYMSIKCFYEPNMGCLIDINFKNKKKMKCLRYKYGDRLFYFSTDKKILNSIIQETEEKIKHRFISNTKESETDFETKHKQSIISNFKIQQKKILFKLLTI